METLEKTDFEEKKENGIFGFNADKELARIKELREAANAEKVEVDNAAEEQPVAPEVEVETEQTNGEQPVAEVAAKEDEFFEKAKDIFSYIGVTKKKSLKVMRALVLPAILAFLVYQVLMLPVAIIDILVEVVVKVWSCISCLWGRILKVIFRH